ncbi:hypothetical protein DSECCO2_518390 [anaerobic digester metagenome]
MFLSINHSIFSEPLTSIASFPGSLEYDGLTFIGINKLPSVRSKLTDGSLGSGYGFLASSVLITLSLIRS